MKHQQKNISLKNERQDYEQCWTNFVSTHVAYLSAWLTNYQFQNVNIYLSKVTYLPYNLQMSPLKIYYTSLVIDSSLNID